MRWRPATRRPRPASWPRRSRCGAAARWLTSRPRRWSRRRRSGWRTSGWTQPNCASRPSSTAATTPRSYPSCGGCWPTIRCARACGCCSCGPWTARAGTPRHWMLTARPAPPSPRNSASIPAPSCARPTRACWPRTPATRPAASRRARWRPASGRRNRSPRRPRSWPRCRPSCPPTWPTSPAAAIRSSTCATYWPAPGRTTPARSASRWSPGRAAWARPRWRCTRRTASGPASPTASCTSTCSGPPPIRCCPRTCWPGSCATWASAGATSRPTRTSARAATGRCWPGAGSWSCSTTPGTPPRSGRCCPAPRPARC